MKFTKMQGSGNDFVVIETSDVPCDWPRLAMAICDRHYGVGADSLLLLLPSDKADFRMRIFDRDGSEAETCGNGLVCLVKHFVNGRAPDSNGRRVSVETLAGIRRAEAQKAGGRISKVRIGMGRPRFTAKELSAALEYCEGSVVDIKSMISCSTAVGDRVLDLNLVSMGNPHAVHFSRDPVSDFPLSEIGSKGENMAIFPNRVNFEVARVLNRQQIEARVWERGVGETLACGSGACAITVAARLRGYIDDRVEIRLPGGILEMEWDGAGEVFLRGPAETVFTGEWPDGCLD